MEIRGLSGKSDLFLKNPERSFFIDGWILNNQFQNENQLDHYLLRVWPSCFSKEKDQKIGCLYTPYIPPLESISKPEEVTAVYVMSGEELLSKYVSKYRKILSKNPRQQEKTVLYQNQAVT